MIWKCGCCFFCFFPNFSPHKMQHHPPATVTAAQHISGASLNFPSFSSTNAKLFTAMSVTRCSGPRSRSVASRTRRRSGSASAKAPRASSTVASLGRGSPRESKSFHGSVGERGHFFYYLWCRGIFVDLSPWWENKIPCFKLFWFHLSSCCRLYWLMLFDACCKYCCLLQSTAFTLRLCRISGCKSAVTRQYSSWLNNTCLLMCWSLWRDWGPHRLSAWSATACSGPNLSAVASARHRSLGPWWCLSHGCAYHMAVRWPTMSPTAVDQHGRQRNFKRMARFAKWPRCGTASSFSQKLPGYWAAIHGPCFQRGIFNQMLLRMRAGGHVFLNLQTFVLHGAGRFKSTHSIVNRHDIEYSR